MFREYEELGKSIYNMEIREDDVWLLTVPKAGTNWMQTLITCVLRDPDGVNIKTAWHHWYFLEYALLSPPPKPEDIGKDNIQLEKPFSFVDCVKGNSPRYMKTHIPLEFLPPKLQDTCKNVYVARNPQDVCVSSFHHKINAKHFNATNNFSEFFPDFVGDRTAFNPYWPHVKEGWILKDHPNVLFVFYEDMKRDLAGSIRKVADFFNKKLTDSQISNLSQVLTMDGMKKNVETKIMKEVIMRKGIVGDWRNHFTDEMIDKMIEWNKKGREGWDFNAPPEWELTKAP